MKPKTSTGMRTASSSRAPITQRVVTVMDVMADERFKKELLTRLDKIIALLSISCAVSNGSLEKSKAEAAIRQVISSRQAENPEAEHSSMNDEMDEIHNIAMRRWKQEHDDKDEKLSVSNL